MSLCEMVITQAFLDSLTAQAKASPRLRMNYDLRNSSADGSHLMLNAVESGTVVPIHRHPTKDESFVILRGKIRVTTQIKDSIIERYLKKYRYLMGIQELFYIFAA